MKGGDQDNGIPDKSGEIRRSVSLSFSSVSTGQQDRETNPREAIRPAWCWPFKPV
jgi:hypothetical protein